MGRSRLMAQGTQRKDSYHTVIIHEPVKFCMYFDKSTCIVQVGIRAESRMFLCWRQLTIYHDE